MTALRSFISALFAVAASLVIPACYTLLKHPAVDTAVYEEVQTETCASCHYEEDLWYYHHSPAHRLYAGPVDGSWEFYYAMPWWYDSYWHYTPPSGPSTIPLPGRGLRPAGDKDAAGGAVGGSIGPPPNPKSTGSTVRLKPPDDDSGNQSKDTGDKKTNDENKKREVRPKSTKEKPKGKGDKGS